MTADLAKESGFVDGPLLPVVLAGLSNSGAALPAGDVR